MMREIEEHIQLTALRWIDSFFEICPEDLCPFVPRLLNQVLPALSSDIEMVRQAGNRVNATLMDYIISLPNEEEIDKKDANTVTRPQSPSRGIGTQRQAAEKDVRELPAPVAIRSAKVEVKDMADSTNDTPKIPSPGPAEALDDSTTEAATSIKLDYEAAVNALTLQFLNENEATRVAALSWLIMLQRKAPRKVRHPRFHD